MGNQMGYNPMMGANNPMMGGNNPMMGSMLGNPMMENSMMATDSFEPSFYPCVESSKYTQNEVKQPNSVEMKLPPVKE